VDMGNFYAFSIIETKDLKSASRSLKSGVSPSAGLGIAGGGVAAMINQKRGASEAMLSQIDVLAKHLSEN
jgi:hypothetical protein